MNKLFEKKPYSKPAVESNHIKYQDYVESLQAEMQLTKEALELQSSLEVKIQKKEASEEEIKFYHELLDAMRPLRLKMGF